MWELSVRVCARPCPNGIQTEDIMGINIKRTWKDAYIAWACFAICSLLAYIFTLLFSAGFYLPKFVVQISRYSVKHFHNWISKNIITVILSTKTMFILPGLYFVPFFLCFALGSCFTWFIIIFFFVFYHFTSSYIIIKIVVIERGWTGFPFKYPQFKAWNRPIGVAGKNNISFQCTMNMNMPLIICVRAKRQVPQPGLCLCDNPMQFKIVFRIHIFFSMIVVVWLLLFDNC